MKSFDEMRESSGKDLPADSPADPLMDESKAPAGTGAAGKKAGCVILFNPQPSVISNIGTYFSSLDLLILVDNSPVKDLVLLDRLRQNPGKLVYKWLGCNEGVASALNIACRIAIENECEWLLTMDQDSRFNESGAASLFQLTGPVRDRHAGVGIITPYHRVNEVFIEWHEEKFSVIPATMTSGNLLYLRAWSSIGGFEEKLFIDYVDFEFCLRLRKNGFQVIQVNQIYLEHSLGDFRIKNFFGRKVGISNHNFIRRYYITRNKLYTIRKYFHFDRSFCLVILKSLLGDGLRVLFYEKDRYRKLRAMFTGMLHFMFNRYGVYAGKGNDVNKNINANRDIE